MRYLRGRDQLLQLPARVERNGGEALLQPAADAPLLGRGLAMPPQQRRQQIQVELRAWEDRKRNGALRVQKKRFLEGLRGSNTLACDVVPGSGGWHSSGSGVFLYIYQVDLLLREY